MDHRMDHILDTGGRSLSVADRQFVTLLFRELEQFKVQAPKDRALMFHPLSGYERYLIHKVTEIFPKLTSFSIGDEKSRRTVVCFKSKRKEQQMQLGQVSPERQPSRNSPREPRTLRPSIKSKTLESPAKGRRRLSDPMGGRVKPNKYHTMDDNALKKRGRGLNMEGHVMNGDGEIPKSDAEAMRRDAWDPQSPTKKHRARRSHSQPHLHERNRPRSRRDSNDSADNQYSDIEGFGRKSKKPNTPEKRRKKVPVVHEDERPPPKRLENEIVRRGFEDIRTSSGTDLSERDTPIENSDADNNEVPPSYDKTTESKAKSNTKRNMRRIKRTNSTISCPPLNNEKHNYVNSEPAVKREAEKLGNSHRESPVFPRREESSPSNAGIRNSDARSTTKAKDKKRSSSKRRGRDGSKPREYTNVPTEEILRPNSYDSLPFEPLSVEATDPIPNDYKETVAIVENPPPESVPDPRIVSSTNSIDGMPNLINGAPTKLVPLSSEILLSSAEAMIVVSPKKLDKDSQTDLPGSLVDVMMSTYNSHLDAFGQPVPLNLPPHPGSTLPPSSLRISGNSTPSLSSPVSTYEKLGEYMYKAMMNFQNMTIGHPANVPTQFSGPTTMYAPVAPAAQPVYMPWMAPYFADPTGSRPATTPYSSLQTGSTGDTCCYMHHRHAHQPTIPLDKMPPRTHSSLKDLRKEEHRSTPTNDHWHRHRYRDTDRTPSSAEHSLSAHPLRSLRVADGFESDVSSEVTNPEVTVAQGGDGLMVYVRNRSTSSTGGGSVGGSANSLQGPGGDNLARASPLGRDNDHAFKKPPKSTISENSKKSLSSKRSSPRSTPKKSRKSPKVKKSDEMPPAEKDFDDAYSPGIANEEVISSLSSAPENSKKSSSSKRNSPRSTPKKSRKSPKVKKSDEIPPAEEDFDDAYSLGIANEEVISSLSSAPENSKKSSAKLSSPRNTPKKSLKSPKVKKSDEISPAEEDFDDAYSPGIAHEEVILSLSSAPLATMEDEEDEMVGSASASYTSSQFEHHEDADAESTADFLIGEDLSPLVCFDDNLEIACQDESAED